MKTSAGCTEDLLKHAGAPCDVAMLVDTAMCVYDKPHIHVASSSNKEKCCLRKMPPPDDDVHSKPHYYLKLETFLVEPKEHSP